MGDLLEHLHDQLEIVFGNKRWILAVDVLASATGTVDWLRRLGAESALCLAGSRGPDPMPDEDFAPDPIVFDLAGHDVMSSVRLAANQLANLPADACARIDAFDPDGVVRVLGTIFDDGRPVGGRTKYGGRPAEWQAIEDKTTIDAMWDDVGVPRSPSEVQPANDFDALWSASQRLDAGAGTVWAADQREGFHGGASFTRRVTNAEQARAVFEDFRDHADSVRVMPFLEGIVCSVHGFVFEGYVAAFRPCEMLVLRCPDGRFLYARAATFWDPEVADRQAMRAMAKHVGGYLRDTFGYRGAFTIDGVMTSDGFRPTELNPRYGAALGIQTQPMDLDLKLVNLAVIEREAVDWRPRELEELVLTIADGTRSGSTMAIVPVRLERSGDVALFFENGVFRRAQADEEPHAIASCGPHPAGGIARIEFISEQTPVGESCAPRAAAALAWADAEWGLELGPLEVPLDVR